MKKSLILLSLLFALTFSFSGCSTGAAEQAQSTDTVEQSQSQPADAPSTVENGRGRARPQQAANNDEDDDTPDAVPVMTISDDGEHTLTGNIEGQVLVTAENVTLILDGAVINSPDGPAILGDDGNGADTQQSLTVELRGENTVTAGVKHGIQGKDNLIITGSGSVSVTAEKDGLHAGNLLDIQSGSVNVVQSYEGLEAPVITLSGGNVVTHASDDGVNAASDDRDVVPALKIFGGSLTIYSGSDGIDSNGTVELTGGTVAIFINAPWDGDPIDVDTTSTILPTLFSSEGIQAGTKLIVQDSSGNIVWDGITENEATSFSLTVPGLTDKAVYTISANGTALEPVTATTTVQGGPGAMGGGMGPMGGMGGRGEMDGAAPPDAVPGGFGGRRGAPNGG